jgi:hypothetical protein
VTQNKVVTDWIEHDSAPPEADSAGSIPVIRSNEKAQFGNYFRTLGLRSVWG